MLSPQQKPTRLHWDIYCKVIDYYGDVGISYRLARQLAHEYGQKVRLIIDDLHLLQEMEPRLKLQETLQTLDGIEILGWQLSDLLQSPDVIIEMLGCGIDEKTAIKLRLANKRTLWINIEYLTAEPFIDKQHLLRSIRTYGLESIYFHPGFSKNSGGLLRERGLLARRDHWLANSEAREVLFGALGFPAPVEHGLTALVFCYAHAGLESWLREMSEQTLPVTVLLPPGAIREVACEWLNALLLHNTVTTRGSLTVCALPVVPQHRFDELLWSVDVAIVRGEDSFVRAQWAGIPFIWQAYPQEDDAHLAKVEAFLRMYTKDMSSDTAKAIGDVWQAWNMGEQLSDSWQQFLSVGRELHVHARFWSEQMALRPSLGHKLMYYVAQRLELPNLVSHSSSKVY